MTELFLKLINMSLSASILVMVVLLLRLVFRGAPRWVSVLLWGLVAVRLICPITIESAYSLMPETEWIGQDADVPEEDFSFDSVPEDIPVDSIIGEDVTVHYYPTDPTITVRRSISASFVLACVWIAGMAAMVLYALISYWQVYRRIRSAQHLQDNVYISESIPSPFVFGILRPRICLPAELAEGSRQYVIAHEQAHICRRDHWWKPLGFLLLTVHWFNPLIWLSYILLCRDIEMACDERVVRDMEEDARADYSQALLECSIKNRMISACPLAFGEVGVKARIRSVLHYKKPAFWIGMLAVIACAVAAVCFLTNPERFVDSSVEGIRFPCEDPTSAVACTVEMNGKIEFDEFRGDFIVDGRRVDARVDLASETPPITYYDGAGLYTYGLIYLFDNDFTKLAFRINESDEYVICGMSLKEFEACMAKKNYYVAYLHDVVLYDLAASDKEVILSDIYTEGRTVVLYGRNLDIAEINRTFYSGDNVVGTTVPATSWGKSVCYACVSTCLNGKVHIGYNRLTFETGMSAEDVDATLVQVLLPSTLREDAYVFRQERIEMHTVLDTAPLPDVSVAQLTLDDVITLSKWGSYLTWEDFAGYACRDVGSGLYICRYDIDETFYLLIGDGKRTGTPMYIRLCVRDSDARADVTTEDIEAFVAQHRRENSTAGVPYTIQITRPDLPIYTEPGYDSSSDGALLKMGAYTITEETTDSEGIRWGRLESGGWIDLDEAVAVAPHIPMTVELVQDSGRIGTEYVEHIVTESEYTQKLLFRAYEPLTDIRFTTLDYTVDGFASGGDLYTLPALDVQTALVIGVVFYGDLTTYGISFTDAGGAVHQYMLYISGRNGSLVMQKIPF